MYCLFGSRDYLVTGECCEHFWHRRFFQVLNAQALPFDALDFRRHALRLTLLGDFAYEIYPRIIRKSYDEFTKILRRESVAKSRPKSPSKN